jgi:predicted nucleic acid-binding Zn ribbon protein
LRVITRRRRRALARYRMLEFLILREREMERARAGLQKIVRDALRRAPEEEAPLLAWPVVCGARVAARTQALGFAEGTLRVEVPDTGWRAQLRDLAPQYLAALNQSVGTRVERIEFVLPAHAAKEEKKPAGKKPKGGR